MKKNKYVIIAIVAAVILLIGIVYLVKDNNGNNVITYKPSKTYQNAVICDNNLQIGGSYSVYADDTKMYDVTISNTISNLGNTGVMGNGIGNGMGGRGGMMQQPPIR